MRIRDAISRLTQTLNLLYDSRESAIITQWVTEKITGYTRSELLIHKDDQLSLLQVEEFERMTGELERHRPVQYVLGEAWFAGLKFYVDERVLIPRPETEEMVEKVRGSKFEVRSAKYEVGREEKGAKDIEGLKILDIGTGSGCIPIALKKKMPDAELWAIDVSEDALEVAIMNARNLHADVHFRKINILSPEEWDQLPVFDIIVSNPPYVPVSDQSEMSKHVTDYEPHVALFVTDEDPLLFYRTIIRFAAVHLRTAGMLFFEVHEKMATGVRDLLSTYDFKEITIYQDLQGRDRILSARRGD